MLYSDPQKLAAFLDRHSNADIELSATFQELGRAPRLWREFIIKYQDRLQRAGFHARHTATNFVNTR